MVKQTEFPTMQINLAQFWRKHWHWIIIAMAILLNIALTRFQQTPDYASILADNEFIRDLLVSKLKDLMLCIAAGLFCFRLLRVKSIWIKVGLCIALIVVPSGIFYLDIWQPGLVALPRLIGPTCGLMTLGLICLQASLQYGRTVYHLLLTTAGYSLLIGALLCVGLIILGDFLLMSYTGPESITKTIRSPDNEHAIVISAQTTRAFIEEAQYTRYKIKRIAGLFQPEWPFYYVYQDTVGVDLSPRLEAIRWTDNNHFTYRIGQQAYYCNIHRLYNLENCTTKQPKN